MGVFKTIEHSAEFCVVGGGLAGLCAAVSAARRGLKVVLMQDRPVLGGNASSEIRMWAMGARGRDNQETGIIEELMLENYYRNPYKNYSIWDSVMYQAARMEDNITLLLNCSCMDAEMACETVADGGAGGAGSGTGAAERRRIRSVTGWQTTTQRFHKVAAAMFADCSGDSVLAPLTGAEYRVGHEARSEFGEDIAPVAADKKTMGMSILIQARETDGPKTYIPPPWAEKFVREKLPHRIPDIRNDGENFWYLELGGDRDSIADTEELRDELLAVAYGMWDFVKNDPENAEIYANFDLDWIGFLPGKRESRRYVGDHILTQGDVRTARFGDVVAYGGWPLDDHHPEGFRTPEVPTIYHPAPSPFGIPYRCLYSKNVENLLFAGRNISVSHVALSSTRVMATCATLGQAAGTAAAVAVRRGTTPRGVYREYMRELQDILMDDDCWLPGLRRAASPLTERAALILKCEGAPVRDPAVLRNGADRPEGDDDNGIVLSLSGDSVTYAFPKPVWIGSARFVFDSDLNRDTQPEGAIHKRPMYATYYLNTQACRVPQTLVRDFRLTVIDGGGQARIIDIKDNRQRLVRAAIGAEAASVRFEPLATWGASAARVFAFDLY